MSSHSFHSNSSPDPLSSPPTSTTVFCTPSKQQPPQPSYQIDLPSDVWHAIADFIPEKDLGNICSVHGALLERYLKMCFSTVCVRKWEDKATCKLLDTIKLPAHAPIVQYLDVQIAGIKRLEIAGRPGITASHPGTLPLSWHSIKRNLNARLAVALAFLKRESPPTFVQTMDLLLSAMPHLTGITHFSVDCWDLDPAYSLHPLLTTAWLSFGSNLTNLSFHGNIDSFQHLSASSPVLSNLTALEIGVALDLQNPHRSFSEERETLEMYLAPFIAAYAPQLKSLTFLFWVDLDLSSFFARIPMFPQLHHMSMHIPYKRSLQDPTTLLRLLTTSTPVLKDIEIRFNPTGAALDKIDETPLVQFLTRLADEPAGFSGLTTLDIFPTHLPEGMPVLLNAVHHASSSLTKLYVRDRSLQPAEVRELVDALSDCEGLEILHFNISELDIEVVQLICSGLQKLKELSIFIDGSWSFGPAISLGLEADLAEHSFPDCSLKSISLWIPDARVDTSLMHAFARSIPSIASFCDVGHMN